MRWTVGLVVFATVVAVAAALFFTGRGSGADAPAGAQYTPQSSPVTAPATSAARPTAISSAKDAGPLVLMTSDVTCGPWDNVQTAVGVAQRTGWAQRDPSVPASAWDPALRAEFEAVGEALRSGADTAARLAAQTPQRIMRELYDAFIVYGRAYADALPTYQAKDDYLAQTTLAALDAITGVCAANRSISAMPKIPDVPPAAPPTAPQTVGDPSSPTRFLPPALPNPMCGPWVTASAALKTRSQAWSALDPGVGVGEWTPQQRAVQDDAAQLFARHADDMAAAGRSSGNAVVEDFATLGALYLRAFAAEEPLYWAGVHDLAEVGLSVDTLVTAACRTVTS